MWKHSHVSHEPIHNHINVAETFLEYPQNIIINPLTVWDPTHIMNVSPPCQLPVKQRHRQTCVIHMCNARAISLDCTMEEEEEEYWYSTKGNCLLNSVNSGKLKHELSVVERTVREMLRETLSSHEMSVVKRKTLSSHEMLRLLVFLKLLQLMLLLLFMVCCV